MLRRVASGIVATAMCCAGALTALVMTAGPASAGCVKKKETVVVTNPKNGKTSTKIKWVKYCDGKVVNTAGGGSGNGSAEPSLVQKQIDYACKPISRPPNHPDWHGRDPDKGSLMICSAQTPTEAIDCIAPVVWSCLVYVPNGQSPGQVIVVDPRVLAEEARGLLQLETANAHIAPGPDFHTYVHIENWMWLDEGQWGELEQTVSLAGTSVTVTAEPTRVEWDMGPETAICPDGGRAWVDGMSDSAQTTCSHAYDAISEPAGDTHPVLARIAYSITWTCSGVCTVAGGDFGEVLAPAGEATTIEVRQRQTVNTS